MPPAYLKLARTHGAALAAIVVATLVAAWPLIGHRSLPFSWDWVFAAQSARGFAAALHEGVLYPRWIAAANGGYGAPTFVFYAPLSYCAAAVASWFTGDPVAALRVVTVASILLSGVSFYVSAQPSRSALAAAVAAVLYVLVPYRALDIYYRGAFAEGVAFIWFPPLFGCAMSVLKRERRRASWVLGACYLGLVLTHLVTAFMVLFVLVPAVLAFAVQRRQLARVPVVALALLAALACSAVYLVPVIVERGQVHLEYVTEAVYGDFHRNFVWQHVAAGSADTPEISPYVDAAVTAQLMLTLIAGLVLVLRHRLRQEGGVYLALCAWTLFLQIGLSTPLWQWIPELATVQFPWRFGAFQALCACLLVSASLQPTAANAGQGVAPSAWRRTSAALVLVALGCVPLLLASQVITESRKYNLSAAKARKAKYAMRYMREYIPRAVDGFVELEALEGDPETERVRMLGKGSAKVVAWSTHARRVRVKTKQLDRLSVRTFAYPGWTARLDGRPVALGSRPADGRIELSIPPGQHDVTLAFEATTDRRLGAWLSVLSLAALLLAALYRARPNARRLRDDRERRASTT